MPANNDELLLAEEIAGYTHDPYGYAMYAFPWGEEGELERFHGPREWQKEALLELGEHLQSPLTRHQPIRLGRCSGHGIGKSAFMGIVNKWALDTCEDTRVLITANTEGQLLTKTSPELAKWSRLSITADWFRTTATKIVSTVEGHADSWRTDLTPWSEHNTEAFAGLHNLGKRIVLMFDESSNIADKVWEVAEGALTDEDTELIWIALGNGTRSTGRFRECFGRHRNRWLVRNIDSRTVEGTNKAYLDELVQTYGINSDLVKVRVLGQFPSGTSAQLIAQEVVAMARTRTVPEPLATDPVIFGVDCARFGEDHSTLAIRCGKDARSRPWKRWHQMDTMQVAGDIMLEAERWNPDAIFVDVGNIGGGVIDRLRQLAKGRIPVFEVFFGNPGREVTWENDLRIKTFNKRSEIWCSMRHWLNAGGCIPDEQVIEDDLCGPEYGYDDGETSIKLERKRDMKKRGMPSPDDGDALACTFAEYVKPRVPAYRDIERVQRLLQSSAQSGNYDPFAELR